MSKFAGVLPRKFISFCQLGSESKGLSRTETGKATNILFPSSWGMPSNVEVVRGNESL